MKNKICVIALLAAFSTTFACNAYAQFGGMMKQMQESAQRMEEASQRKSKQTTQQQPVAEPAAPQGTQNQDANGSGQTITIKADSSTKSMPNAKLVSFDDGVIYTSKEAGMGWYNVCRASSAGQCIKGKSYMLGGFGLIGDGAEKSLSDLEQATTRVHFQGWVGGKNEIDRSRDVIIRVGKSGPSVQANNSANTPSKAAITLGTIIKQSDDWTAGCGYSLKRNGALVIANYSDPVVFNINGKDVALKNLASNKELMTNIAGRFKYEGNNLTLIHGKKLNEAHESAEYKATLKIERDGKADLVHLFAQCGS